MDRGRRENLERLDRLAWLLDSSIPVPGTRWHVGWDGLIGLLPGIGDLVAGGLSSYILLQALWMGLPPAVLGRMGLNIVLESVVGMVPVAGDLFDFAFKANQRNVRLMRAYLEDPRATRRRSALTITVLSLVILAGVVLTLWAMFALLEWLIRAVA